jgi:hypothetical protein
MNVHRAIRFTRAPAFLLSLCAVVLFALAGRATADPRKSGGEASPGFEIVSLQRPGVILAADSGDFNGDGATDLLLFHKSSKETYEKTCLVYLQQDGSFEPTPSYVIPLGESVGAVEAVDLDGDGASELCGFSGGGMTVFETGDESRAPPRRAIEYATLLPGVSRRLVVVNWIADVNSDGRPDVLLPAADGLRLFVGKGDGDFTDSRMYELPTRASVSGESGQNYVSYRLPTIEFSDFDNDGRTDIGAFDLEQMNFFLTDGSPAPGRRVVAPLVTKFTKDFIAAASFPDLNSDGIPDAALVLMSQKKNLQSEARIYFGAKDLSYGDRPDHVYSGDTSLVLPMFLDAAGDGKMELLVQNINVGFGFFLNYFLRNRIRVDTQIHRLGADGRYGERPAARRAIYVRASESGVEPARGVGDFNGDGLDDLVVGTAERRLSFFLSDPEEILPRSPTFELSAHAYGKMKTMNLNGDARADILILYPQEDRLGTATLLLSK